MRQRLQATTPRSDPGKLPRVAAEADDLSPAARAADMTASRPESAICGYFEETALCRRSPGVTAIAPTGRPSPGARFAKGLCVLYSAGRPRPGCAGASTAPGRAARGPDGPTCRYPDARSFALLPGRLLPFAGSGRSGFLSARTTPLRPYPDIRDHPDPVQVFRLTYAYVHLSRQISAAMRGLRVAAVCGSHRAYLVHLGAAGDPGSLVFSPARAPLQYRSADQPGPIPARQRRLWLIVRRGLEGAESGAEGLQCVPAGRPPVR